MFRTTTFAFLLFCYFQKSECQEVPAYRSDYKYVQEFNAFYKVHKDAQKWSDAVATCRGEGSEMLVPNTKKELEMAMNMANVFRFWIAAHDMFSEGDFVTLDGKPFSEKYVNWRGGEPNNSGGNENCVVKEADGVYLDFPCDRVEMFICKKLAVNITLNPICESHDSNYQYSLELDRCYKFHSEPLNWQLAFKTCRNEGSSLVIINSKEEAQLLVKLFAKYPESLLKGKFEKGFIHIGFNDLLSNGIYLTTEGQTLSEAGYDEWSPNNPDNYENNEHCGSMYRDGTLNDLSCLARAMFVCEKKLSASNKTADNKSSIPRLPDDDN